MTYALAVELAHQHLAKSDDIALYPAVALDVFVQVHTHLALGIDAAIGERVVALNRDKPISVLGMSNAWMATTHRLLWLAAGTTQAMDWAALRSVKAESGMLGSSLHVKVVDEASGDKLVERTVEVPDVPKFKAFLEALLEVPPLQRSPTAGADDNQFHEPRTQVLAALLEAQSSALSAEEAARRYRQLTLLEHTLWQGRPMMEDKWRSPLDLRDFEAVMPWAHGRPYRRSDVQGELRVRMRKTTFASALGERALDVATFGIAGGLQGAAGAARAVAGAFAARDTTWSRAVVSPGANEVNCRLSADDEGVGFRYYVAGSLVSSQPFTLAEQKAAVGIQHRLPYDEARAMLLRWLYGDDLPMEKLLNRPAHEVDEAVKSHGIEVGYAPFVVDLHGFAWCERLDRVPQGPQLQLVAPEGRSQAADDPAYALAAGRPHSVLGVFAHGVGADVGGSGHVAVAVRDGVAHRDLRQRVADALLGDAAGAAGADRWRPLPGGRCDVVPAAQSGLARCCAGAGSGIGGLRSVSRLVHGAGELVVAAAPSVAARGRGYG